MIEIDGLTKRSGDKAAVERGSRPGARSPGLARQHDSGDVVLPPVTGSPSVQLADDPGGWLRDRVRPATQYRHPGNVIRLMAAAGGLAAAAGTAALLPALLRPAAAAVLVVEPAAPAGRVLTGLVQVVIAAAALVLLVAALRYRQSRRRRRR
jgi:hypothetical protein